MLRKFAKGVRHLPGLEKQEWLWDLMRGPYHRLLSIGGRGTKISIAGAVNARLPAEYSGSNWETDEPESFDAVVKWARANPGGLFLDIGCEIGSFSLAALFAEPSLSVIAFDSDLSSIAATLQVCRYSSGNRLKVLWGCLTDSTSDSVDFATASTHTKAVLDERKPTGAIGTTQFITLDSEQANDVPKYTLDKLFADRGPRQPILLKCDVEGAELLVLHGARRFIAKARPELLLSVHPQMLRNFGHTIEQIADFLHRAGYQWDVIAIDHEEHWFCIP